MGKERRKKPISVGGLTVSKKAREHQVVGTSAHAFETHVQALPELEKRKKKKKEKKTNGRGRLARGREEG